MLNLRGNLKYNVENIFDKMCINIYFLSDMIS